jgi:hypothetical protein
MPAAAPAIPLKPNTAAISAIMRNVIVQLSIVFSFFFFLEGQACLPRARGEGSFLVSFSERILE